MSIRHIQFVLFLFVLSACALASRGNLPADEIPVSKPVLLRGMVYTQRELLDSVYRGEYLPDSADTVALNVVYCDLIRRGVVEKTYVHCETSRLNVEQQCSARFYYQLAKLSSIHDGCKRCVSTLVNCLDAGAAQFGSDEASEQSVHR